MKLVFSLIIFSPAIIGAMDKADSYQKTQVAQQQQIKFLAFMKAVQKGCFLMADESSFCKSASIPAIFWGKEIKKSSTINYHAAYTDFHGIPFKDGHDFYKQVLTFAQTKATSSGDAVMAAKCQKFLIFIACKDIPENLEQFQDKAEELVGCIKKLKELNLDERKCKKMHTLYMNTLALAAKEANEQTITPNESLQQLTNEIYANRKRLLAALEQDWKKFRDTILLMGNKKCPLSLKNITAPVDVNNNE